MAKNGQKLMTEFAFESRRTEMGAKAIEFVEWLRVKNYSPKTANMRMRALHYFLSFCEERAITRIAELSPELIETYRKHLLYRKDKLGKPFSPINSYIYLTGVSKFCWWLVHEDILLSNPAAKLIYPKVPKNLPSRLLTHKQIEEILSLVDTTRAWGIRDRAMMELIYSSGMRRSEAASLTLQDADLQNGLMYIRQGKGGKARVVPVGERAIQWLEKYLTEVRNSWHKNEAVNALFLTSNGRPITREALALRMKHYVRGCGLRGSCHSFRHAMATEMLGHGADLRHIQEILGHESIATTQIYTHTNIEKIKEIYKETHPASKFPEPQVQKVNTKVRKHKSESSPKHIPRRPWPENELGQRAQRYMTSLRMAGYSERSLVDYQSSLKQFVSWCQEEEISEAKRLSHSLLERYHKYLTCRESRGRPIGIRCIEALLARACQFCRFLADKEALPYDITQKIELPRVKKNIPCQVLSPQEVARILAQPDVSKALGLRDRAVLEVLYATGIRWDELKNLETGDINAEAGTVFIRKGKGSKQRIVPIAPCALAWVEKYLELVRPLLIKDETQKTLFLSNNGRFLSLDRLRINLKKYAKGAGVEKPVTCHKFRHAMATALLDNGADIRTVQEILGHSSLTSTQLYTKVAIRKLKEVHERTHPAHSKPQGERKDEK